MENGDLWQRSTLYLSGSSQNLLCGSTLAGTVCLPGASSPLVHGAGGPDKGQQQHYLGWSPVC